MVMPLHHEQLVGGKVLPRHVPGLARTTDADPLALADRIEGEPDVLAERAATFIDDRSRRLRQIAVEEFAERPLADEADAGRVLLGVVRQPRLECDAAHLAFLQLAHREQHAGELLLPQAMQEVTLVLAGIEPAQQPVASIGRVDARVMTRRDLRRAQAHGVVEERLELDLGIAQHVGIGSASRRVFAQELGEHPVFVFGREIDRLELDADHVRRRGGVDQVLARRAVLVGVVVLPVLHEKADHVVALAL